MSKCQIPLYSILLALIFILPSCQTSEKVKNPYDHIQDQKVIATLKKSFATIGGLENWQNRKELHYEKHTKLYFESGEIEQESHQLHDYFYHNNPSININWKSTDSKQHKIVSKNGHAEKYVDNQLDKSAKTEALNNSITTSLFVISVPFKLIDKGVILSHEGIDTLEDGHRVEVIKAIYNPSEHGNHTKPDVWWYYFDENDQRLVAYFIQHDGRYSYVKNTAYVEVDGFLFPKNRGSYRVNANREILFTRANYEYTNWQIR